MWNTIRGTRVPLRFTPSFVALALAWSVSSHTGVVNAQTPSAPQKIRVIGINEAIPAASVKVAPGSITLATGAAHRFSAAVSGTANASVTWSATGGTIASNGLYTAGSQAGTFAVVATLANGTIAGTASVTICGLSCDDPTAATRDWRKWPFSSTSPWNHPIGSSAQYADVGGLSSLGIGINYDNHWTSSVVIARDSDPLATIALHRDTWTFLAGGGRVCGNTAADEQKLKQASTTSVLFAANYYSTLSTPDTSRWVLPADYKPASTSYWPTARLPVGACASPDTDALMAVFQPNGWVLDVYNAIVLSDNTLIGGIASYVDARGDGTGWWNGRRASMLPSFAGLIRTGEIAAGRIPHALAVTMSPTVLKQQAVWPAYAFDRNAGYSGTLPMGSLLAIPASVNLDNLGLSAKGKILARAAQGYGVYVVDRGGAGGMTFMAELGNPEIRWQGDTQDLTIIRNQLKRVTNNSAQTPGGGGTLLAPMAPPLTN
jgi:hypothetical protein